MAHQAEKELQELPEATLKWHPQGSFMIHHGEHEDDHHGEAGAPVAGGAPGAQLQVAAAPAAAPAAAGAASPVPKASAPVAKAPASPAASGRGSVLSAPSNRTQALYDTEALEAKIVTTIRLDHLEPLESKVSRLETRLKQLEDRTAASERARTDMRAATSTESNALGPGPPETSSLSGQSPVTQTSETTTSRPLGHVVTHKHLEEDFDRLQIMFENRVDRVNTSLRMLQLQLKALQQDVPRFKRKQEMQCIAVGMLAINAIDLPEDQRATTLHDLEERGAKLHQILKAVEARKDEADRRVEHDPLARIADPGDMTIESTFPDKLPSSQELAGRNSSLYEQPSHTSTGHGQQGTLDSNGDFAPRTQSSTQMVGHSSSPLEGAGTGMSQI